MNLKQQIIESGAIPKEKETVDEKYVIMNNYIQGHNFAVSKINLDKIIEICEKEIKREMREKIKNMCIEKYDSLPNTAINWYENKIRVKVIEDLLDLLQ